MNNLQARIRGLFNLLSVNKKNKKRTPGAPKIKKGHPVRREKAGVVLSTAWNKVLSYQKWLNCSEMNVNRVDFRFLLDFYLKSWKNPP